MKASIPYSSFIFLICVEKFFNSLNLDFSVFLRPGHSVIKETMANTEGNVYAESGAVDCILWILLKACCCGPICAYLCLYCMYTVILKQTGVAATSESSRASPNQGGLFPSSPLVEHMLRASADHREKVTRGQEQT